MSQSPKISGFTLARNCFEGDYNLAECIDSMLPVCDEVVVSDGGSVDGTLEYLQRRAAADPRIRIVHYAWRFPKGDSGWFTHWLNSCREHLQYPTMLQLDSDEILDDSPECHEAIREAARDGIPHRVNRLNYWKHIPTGEPWLIPDGHCVGKWVVRIGPSRLWMPSDEPHILGDLEILDAARDEPKVRIHHVGFMRRKAAFYQKSHILIEGFFTRWDQRLEIGEKAGNELWETTVADDYKHLLKRSEYPISDAVQKWLADRGHNVENYLPILPAPALPKLNIVSPRHHEPMPCLHSGDLGDLIHFLAVAKAIGSVDIIAINRGITKNLTSRLHLIQPLLESQSYVNSVKVYEEGMEAVWNASDFRSRHQWTQSLAYSHLLHYRSQQLPAISPDFRKPWITGIRPDERARNRIIAHRTARYNNSNFPWQKIVEQFRDQILVVGTEDEHRVFVELFGRVAFLPTSNLLEIAQLIAGSSLVIAGQSCVLAIAEAMKHPRIAEISPSQPDVIVALGPDVQYVADGNVRLPDIAGSGKKFISSLEIEWENINTSITPPGGWHHPDMACRPMHINAAVANLAGIKSISNEEARSSIIRHNVDRCPDFYTDPGRRQAMGTYDLALQNALK